MKIGKTLVRSGPSRFAPGGSSVLAVGGVLLILASATHVLADRAPRRRAEPPVPVAQDTTHVRALLDRVRSLEPTICHLVGRALGNRWGGWHGWESTAPYGSMADDALMTWIDTDRIEREQIPLLRRALSDGDACVRRTAAQLLGRTRVADLSLELRAELSSPSALTREAALISLGHTNTLPDLAAARTGLRDADASVRVAAAWVLGTHERADAVAPLSAAAQDAEARVRHTVAWALGETEHAEAIPPLLRLLESDRDPQVRRAAAAALGRIGG